MIHSWNGSTGADTILGLLTYIPLVGFEGMYAAKDLMA